MKSATHPSWRLRWLSPDTGEARAAWGVLILRVIVGALIFYIHGWHKLEGGIAFLRDGTPWQLVTEVAEMGLPAPLAAAFFATAVQFVCAPLIAFGFATRLNAAVLTAVLGGAIAQNLGAHRDPQLALLYTLVVAAFILIGGGRFSLDARLAARTRSQPPVVPRLFP
ncbi:MAG: DoxX family protein [Verrucomicrobia bacterium]|nr:DoxX family protein [Verrucomicrobiota bacterium]